ncbi:MAG: amino acid adenylation domain-containing protein, partial [Alphaproteobacteria bacterium]
RLVERHEMLRAVFGEDATQRILPVEQVPMCAVPVHDLTGLAPDEAAEQRAGVERHFRDEGFDPARPPLFRFAIVRDRAGDVLHFACDLIVADGPSLFLLLDELATLYDAPDAALPPIGFSFRDYVLEQRRRAPALAAARDYWAARLDRLPGPPALPVLPGDPTGVGFTRLSALLERAGWAAFQRHASAHGLTAVGAVMTAFAQSLAAWAEAPEFCLNVTLATRRAMHPDVFRLVADFTGNVLLAIPPRDGSSFADHARAIARQLAADAERAEHSAVQVMAALSGRRRSPVAMPVVFTALLGYATLLKRPVAIDAIGRYLGGATRTPQVWLDAQALEAEEGLHLSWDLREGVLAPDVASNMFAGFMAHVRRLAEDAAAWDEPAAPASDAADLAPRRAANATAARLPREPIFAGILRQAGARPEVEALVAADRRLTFAALADEATAAARSLVAQGLRSGDLVAVVMPKGWRQIVAALATVLAGGAYVPIELPAPAARIRDLVERAGARFALVHEAPLLDWPCTAHRLDRLPPAPEASLPEVAAGDLAYIIYTSGSTGTPKGVAMAHDAVSNTLHDVNGRFAVGPGDRVLGLSSLGFDLSVWDIFGVLGAGGALVLPAPESLRDPAHLSALATGEGVTLWNTTPAYLKLMMEAPGATLPATLRLAMLSGDWIPLGLARRMLAEHPGVRLVSLGGATEAAIWSIWHPIDRVEADWTSIPYGRPLANQRFHVLDEGMASVPTGEIGQLHIAGAGLAEGYWRDPDRTAESFIRHPETGERLYRTGDYGRYLPDGAIEFLGRRDAQVKIGGHRIELAEVEAALMRLPGIAEAVALPIDDAGGNRRLAAAYRTDGGVTPEVRGTLAEILPSYMIPAVLLAVDRMPLTANGKVDRRALADRAAERLAGARPPQAQAAARLVSPPATARDPDRFVAEMMASAGVLQDEAARCAFVASARGTRRDLGHLPAVALPPAPPRENGPERRSVRRFAVGPLSRERLSALLAPLQSMPTAEGTRRRYASAGSTYAVQVYLVVARGGVEAGLWHYDADAHRLSRLGECPVSPASLHVATNRPMAAAAAVTILLIGDLAAIRPIYGELAPDLMRVEAGGIGHLLEETAAGLGIGLCAVGWLDMAPIAAVLRLTPDHMLVHALVAGEPATVAPHVVASGPDPELRDLVRGAWRRVLGHDDFADDASFFEVGGNSFLAVALQTDLAGRLAAPPSVTDLFRHPTVAALARHLGGGGPAAPVPATPAPTPVAPFDPLAERRSRRLAARLNGGSHPVYAAGE